MMNQNYIKLRKGAFLFWYNNFTVRSREKWWRMKKSLEPHEVRFYIGGCLQRRLESTTFITNVTLRHRRLLGDQLVLNLVKQPSIGGRLNSTLTLSMRKTRILYCGNFTMLSARWMDERPMILHPAPRHKAKTLKHAKSYWRKTLGWQTLTNESAHKHFHPRGCFFMVAPP